MASIKEFNLPDIGTVTVRKHPQSRAVRLSIDAKGAIRVSIPKWLPYNVGVQMAQRQREWINKQLAKHPTGLLEHGQRIGKAHQLAFVSSDIDEPKARQDNNSITITHPIGTPSSDALVQTVAERAIVRTLRQEADNLLPQRLDTLAIHFGFEYRSVSCRQLKTRWGSCDAQKHITLNIYLMQLPWHLIDYVLIHELAHTEELNHSTRFWEVVENCSPNYKALRKELKQYRPHLLQKVG